MYKPKFNSVLVEIDDRDAIWGGENNEAMLGKSYSKGKFISITEVIQKEEYQVTPAEINDFLLELIGKDIMWNEGVESGTTFEEDGKLYGFIYWFDIRGVKDDVK